MSAQNIGWDFLVSEYREGGDFLLPFLKWDEILTLSEISRGTYTAISSLQLITGQVPPDPPLVLGPPCGSGWSTCGYSPDTQAPSLCAQPVSF
eukprot:6674257-Karenia_brevis.AAC.1